MPKKSNTLSLLTSPSTPNSNGSNNKFTKNSDGTGTHIMSLNLGPRQEAAPNKTADDNNDNNNNDKKYGTPSYGHLFLSTLRDHSSAFNHRKKNSNNNHALLPPLSSASSGFSPKKARAALLKKMPRRFSNHRYEPNENSQDNNNDDEHNQPFRPPALSLQAVSDIEKLAQKSGTNTLDERFKVMPDYAYPNTKFTRDELRVEMNKTSAYFHDLRLPSRRGEEVGTVAVEILQCFGIPKPDLIGETSAFCLLVCGSYAFKTDIMPPVANPMWLCRMRRAAVFPIFHAFAKLYVGVFGHSGDSKKKDGFAGRIVLDLSRTRPGCTYDVTLPLRESAQVYMRRQRGAIRLRFHVEWHSEQAAILSYLPEKISMDFTHPHNSVTVPCCDTKSFQNIARVVHGNNVPGHFSMKKVKATMREVNFTQIRLLRHIIQREVYYTMQWQTPLISAFVFLAWMHSIYRSTVQYLPGHVLTFFMLHLWKNYAVFVIDSEVQNGFLPPTWEELFWALVRGNKKYHDQTKSNDANNNNYKKSIMDLSQHSTSSTNEVSISRRPSSSSRPSKTKRKRHCIQPLQMERKDPTQVHSALQDINDAAVKAGLPTSSEAAAAAGHHGKHQSLADTDDGDTVVSRVGSNSAPSHRNIHLIAEAFKKGMKGETLRYYWKSYKNSFSGKQIVDFLISKKYASTRQEAEIIALRLATELRIFAHVAGKNDFKDSTEHIYSFVSYDTSQYIIKTHQPWGTTLFKILGLSRTTPAFHAQLEMPYASGDMYPRFTVKESLVIRSKESKYLLQSMQTAEEIEDERDLGATSEYNLNSFSVSSAALPTVVDNERSSSASSVGGASISNAGVVVGNVANGIRQGISNGLHGVAEKVGVGSNNNNSNSINNNNDDNMGILDGAHALDRRNHEYRSPQRGQSPMRQHLRNDRKKFTRKLSPQRSQSIVSTTAAHRPSASVSFVPSQHHTTTTAPGLMNATNRRGFAMALDDDTMHESVAYNEERCDNGDIIEIKILPPPPNQDMDVVQKSEKKITNVLNEAKEKMHGYLLHLFNVHAYKIDHGGRKGNSHIISPDDPTSSMIQNNNGRDHMSFFRSSQNSTHHNKNKKQGYFKSDDGGGGGGGKLSNIQTTAQIAKHLRSAGLGTSSKKVQRRSFKPLSMARGEEIDVAAKKEEYDRLLQLGKYSHSNPLISKIAVLIQPMIEMAVAWLSLFRALFNLFTWRDPILTFWVSLVGPFVIILLHFFPWRIVLGVVGIVLVGPQNWAVRLYRESQPGYQPLDLDTKIKRRKPTKRTEEEIYDMFGTDEDEIPYFSMYAPDNCPVVYEDVDPNKVRKVVVPYSPLTFQHRFYDWPPETDYARVAACAPPQDEIRSGHRAFEPYSPDPKHHDGDSVSMAGERKSSKFLKKFPKLRLRPGRHKHSSSISETIPEHS